MKTRSLFFLLAVFLNTMVAFAQRDPHNPNNYFNDEGCWGTINIEVGETKTISCSSHIPNLSKLKSIIWEEYLSAGKIKIISQSSTSCKIEGMTSGNGEQLWCLFEYGDQSYPYNTYKAYYLINVTSKGKLKLSASPNGGNVEKGTKVYLTTDQSDADIYYTFGNDYPTTSSTKYTSAGITINESCTLRAIATKQGYDTSERMSWTFTVVKPKGIEINATNFPDENFRNYLLAQSYGKDDVLTDEEIKEITYMNVDNKNISSLKGIEYFTALTYLDCGNNHLASLDISKNISLITLYCDNNELSSLDVSKNVMLENLSYGDQLIPLEVDISRNTKLIELFCYGNQLSSLDVSKNAALTLINCSRNMIKGASMDALISSLPINLTDFNDTHTYAILLYNDTRGNEGNVCTKRQVAAIKAKGWIPEYYNGTGWLEYEGSEDVAPTGITVSPSSQTIKVGDTFTLEYTLTPSEAVTTLTWTSDDETIATVSSEGVVKGLKKGQTFINAKTENGKTAYCKLTVTAAEPADITLPNTATLYVGETITLTPTITPEDAETTLTWKSDDESVVQVDANGVLTGVSEGLALVTVSTTNGLTSNACKVKVELPSSISDMLMDENTDVLIYTISGQRLAAPKKGFNIIGGKKVFIK